MITAHALAIGIVAALVVGVSKTALPGAALIATPLFALVVQGRLLPGTTLPVLVFADLFAVSFYGRHAHLELLRSLVPSVAAGFAAGTAFFVIVGKSTRIIDVVIALSILAMVLIQVFRLATHRPATVSSATTAAGYGAAGGFTTFVSNAAGPVMNTFLLRLGLDKHALVGTSAWFYFAVNLAKIPIYLALGHWTTGGAFFTGDSLRYDLVLAPAVVCGVLGGRALFRTLRQDVFLAIVLVLSAAGALKLLLP